MENGLPSHGKSEGMDGWRDECYGWMGWVIAPVLSKNRAVELGADGWNQGFDSLLEFQTTTSKQRTCFWV